MNDRPDMVYYREPGSPNAACILERVTVIDGEDKVDAVSVVDCATLLRDRGEALFTLHHDGVSAGAADRANAWQAFQFATALACWHSRLARREKRS